MMENQAGMSLSQHSKEPIGSTIDSIHFPNMYTSIHPYLQIDDDNFNIKHMSYYLQDPYKYTPKCFPFLDPTRPYSKEFTSTRITQKNREIEGAMVLLKHQYMSEIHEQNKNSEINLLKVRSLMKSLKGPSNQELASIKCQIYGNRRNKENNLRRNSHNFPEFIKHKQLLNIDNHLQL